MSILSDLQNCTKEERVKAFNLLINHPDTEPVFIEKVKSIISDFIVTSDFQILPRLAAVESVTGLNDYSDFEEEDREPSIPEKIQEIEEKIEEIKVSPINTVKEDKEPTSKTEIRASLLVKELKKSGKGHLTSKEIITFLKSRLPENCRIKDNVQNIRKVKQEVLKKADSMFSYVNLSKKKTGHKEVRLILVS
jgi:anion-transporting  ArsA/GET3 family ATPase